MEIGEIIKKRVSEHEVEMVGCQQAVDAILSQLTNKSDRDIVTVNKLGILKDKMLFHKACKMCLEDLLNEIQV